MDTCEHSAHHLENGIHIYQRDLCTHCQKCTQECFSGALVATGREISLEMLLQEIDRDQAYYRNSGGGVTLSGGEPLLQTEFVKQLLIETHQRGYHNAIDTAGNVPWDWIEYILPETDLFLYDIKAYDSELHRQATGVDNERILDNLTRLARSQKEIWIRIPIIPGVNDSPDEMEKIARFLVELRSITQVELLPFHSLGSEKYASLGRSNHSQGLKPPARQVLTELMNVLSARRLPVRCME